MIFMSYENSEGVKSQFNAGVALTQRIDSLQRAINAARYNPFAINPETMTYNWQVMIDSLNGLYQEGRPKFTDAEQKDCEQIRGVVDKLIEFSPPVMTQTQGRYGTQRQSVDYESWTKLKKLLTIYEQKLRQYFDVHNLNSPNREDDDGL